MKQKKLCSVIIPMYNGSETIRQATQSVQNQSYDNLEILVIDDQSTDRSSEIVKELAKKDARIHIIENKKNLGIAQSRNIGFENSEGEYIALLDSDDVWNANKLEQQITALQNSNSDFCYTSYAYINAAGEEIGPPHIVPNKCTYKDLLKENFICCSSAVLRTELTQKYKMTKDFFHEDFIYWLELLNAGYSGIGCNQVLVKYRVSKKGRSYNKISAAKNRWQVYRKYCKLDIVSSLYYFSHYAFHGFQKYRKMEI